MSIGEFHTLSSGDVAGLQNALFLYFVAPVGLVGYAVEFLQGRTGLRLRLGLLFGCMSPADMIFKYVCVCIM